jgi:hypothetical protein
VSLGKTVQWNAIPAAKFEGSIFGALPGDGCDGLELDTAQVFAFPALVPIFPGLAPLSPILVPLFPVLVPHCTTRATGSGSSCRRHGP